MMPTPSFIKSKEIRIGRLRLLEIHRVFEIFNHKGFAAKMEFLFWQILCPYPDQTKAGMWWYGISGRIAGRFHKIACDRCREKYA